MSIDAARRLRLVADGSGPSPAPLRRRLCGVLLVLALASLSACGLPREDSVDRVAVPSAPTALERSDPPPRGQEIAVWFVRETRLEAVPRWASGPRTAGAVELLLVGPTRAEVGDGLRTALSPVDLAVLPSPPGSGIVTIAVGRDFAEIGGGNQLLAVAQVVWTATQFRSVDQVCFTLDGTPVEVPTDTGLLDRPVGRSDYLSVAPRPSRGTTTGPAVPSPSHRSDLPSTTTARATDCPTV